VRWRAGAADILLTPRLLRCDRVKGRKKTVRRFRSLKLKLEELEISRVKVEVKVICFQVLNVVTVQRYRSRNLLLRWFSDFVLPGRVLLGLDKFIFEFTLTDFLHFSLRIYCSFGVHCSIQVVYSVESITCVFHLVDTSSPISFFLASHCASSSINVQLI
jgi:hypothetical protein